MATLTVTFTAGSNVGTQLRKLAGAFETVTANMPDVVSTGASTVCTITAPDSPGDVSVQITAGPYTGAKVFV